MKKKWSILDGSSFEQLKAEEEYFLELVRLSRAAEDKFLEDRHEELFGKELSK